jgi:hypothetical protein
MAPYGEYSSFQGKWQPNDGELTVGEYIVVRGGEGIIGACQRRHARQWVYVVAVCFCHHALFPLRHACYIEPWRLLITGLQSGRRHETLRCKWYFCIEEKLAAEIIK